MRRLSRTVDQCRPYALLAVRIIVGGLFLYHGIDKFDAGISMVEGMFRSWGVPAPGLAAPLTAVLEIVGGVAIIAGVGTRVASAVLGLVMVGAIIYVKADLGIFSSEPMPGAELDLAYLAGLITLMAHGARRWSVDAMLSLDAGADADDAVIAERRRELAGTR
ncbi:MAG: DoxX family protein [Acidimicrobiia bacterium]